MSKLSHYFADYATYHQTRGNQWTHVIGIPMIVISVLAFASRWVWLTGPWTELPFHLLQLDFAAPILILATLWYCILDWRLGLPFGLVLVASYWVGRAIPNSAAGVFFVLGWTFQLVGHGVYEKKSPAFSKNIEHLLIGPLWVFVKILHLEMGSTTSRPSQNRV